MKLQLKNFAQLIEDMSAALQSSASKIVDVSVGSVARALFEANASVVLWMQWMVLRVLQVMRAATSTGPDLDSWMADFDLSRLPAKPSSGQVTFSRFAPNYAATLPVGTMVKTADGALTFNVVEDQTISTWQAASSAYILPNGVSSAVLPVVCQSAGQIGNVLGGSISTIASSLPGVDLVINANPFTNGADAEGDQAFRDRFQVYLAGLSRATPAAVRSAIANVQQGLDVLIQENSAADGSWRPGSFSVIVDDGSGQPSSALLATIYAAIDAVRPVGTIFSVQAPQVLVVNVTMTIFLPSNSLTIQSTVIAVETNVAAYLNDLPIGQVASVTRVAQCAYLAAPEVTNITGIFLNGLASDVAARIGTVIKAGQIVASPQ